MVSNVGEMGKGDMEEGMGVIVMMVNMHKKKNLLNCN